MKRLLSIAALTVFLTVPSYARSYYWNYVSRGNATALTSITGTTTKVQGSYPSASIRAYACGTTTEVDVFSSSTTLTPLAQPFAASSTGFYSFWTDAPCVKLQFSGGGLPATVTIDNAVISQGTICDVVSFGADATGVLSSDTAIANAISTCGSNTPRGTVYFPRGTYLLSTGNLSLNGLNGLKIKGEGKGSSVVEMSHASNDIFTWTSGALTDLWLGDLTFTSTTVTRTAGWVFRGEVTYNSGSDLQNSTFTDIEIRKQVNGIWVSKFDVDWMDRVLMWDFVGDTGIGLKLGQSVASDVNQGAEFRISNTIIWGSGALSNGAATSHLGYAYWFENCDGIYMTGSIGLNAKVNVLRVTAGAANVDNLFFADCTFEGTTSSHVIYLTGTGSMSHVSFDDLTWIAGAGQYSTPGTTTLNGFYFDAAGMSGAKILPKLVAVNTGNGISINTVGNFTGPISVGRMYWNGITNTASDNHDIKINVGSGLAGPTITNCRSEGTYNSSANIRTSSTSTNLTVADYTNIFPNGVVYGVTPNASGHILDPSKPYAIDGVIYDDHAVHNNVGAGVSTVLGPWTFKANGLANDGDRIFIEAKFFAVTSNTQVYNIDFGGTLIQLNATNPSANQTTKASLEIERKGASSQNRFGSVTVGSTVQAENWNTMAVDLTQDIPISVKIQGTGSADGALVSFIIRKVSVLPR